MAINEGTAVFRFHNPEHGTRVDIRLPWGKDNDREGYLNVYVSPEQGRAIDLVLCPKNYSHYEEDDYCNCQLLGEEMFQDPRLTVEMYPPDNAWVMSGPNELIWDLMSASG